MLEIDEICVQRPSFDVRVASIALPPGQRLTIIGPSGCGKSTLLRALIGLESTAQVTGLRWHSQDLTRAPPHLRPFGWLPQELGLWPHLNALQHVAFARSRGRSVLPELGDHQALARVQLGHRATAFPAKLSGGEQQRLAFARVVSQQPAFAVLDEPFSHLDPVTAQTLEISFSALAKDTGMGVLQVSHQVRRPQPQELFWVMDAGELIQAGTWSDLQLRPASPWIARFVELQG